MHISRLVAIVVAVSFLAGCQSTKNPVSQKNIFEVEAGYDATFLVPASAYSRLPLCAAGTTISASNVCASKSVLGKLQQADRNVQASFTAARNYVTAHPTLDASAYLTAAILAVSAAEALAVQNNIRPIGG